jgi:hypothetical protein
MVQISTSSKFDENFEFPLSPETRRKKLTA